MSLPVQYPPEAYRHEHAVVTPHEVEQLLSRIEDQGLRDMWDMILSLDYEVESAYELKCEERREFCGIISVLLQAFA